MKIAVISDLHANFEATKAVYANVNQWQPDFVVVAGDIINRGPRPLECLEFVLEKKNTDNWTLLRGNHEDYVITWDRPTHWLCGHAAEVHRASRWTYRRLHSDVSALYTMPFQHSIWGPDGREIRFAHASMINNRDGIYPETNEALLFHKVRADYPRPRPALFCVGHTHRPLIRRVDDILIVNAGSSGLPFDLNWRPSYAQLSWINNRWKAEIVRVNYDISKAEKDFKTTGYIEDAGPLAKLVLIELLEARSMLYHWVIEFQKPVLNGDINMEDSVKQFLNEY